MYGSTADDMSDEGGDAMHGKHKKLNSTRCGTREQDDTSMVSRAAGFHPLLRKAAEYGLELPQSPGGQHVALLGIRYVSK